jgi:hypothetical protein
MVNFSHSRLYWERADDAGEGGLLIFPDLIQTRVCSLLPEINNSSLVVCVGVMYSGEYDVCAVTLSVHPHRAS